MTLEKLTRQAIATLKPTEKVVWVEGLNLGIWTGKSQPAPQGAMMSASLKQEP